MLRSEFLRGALFMGATMAATPLLAQEKQRPDRADRQITTPPLPGEVPRPDLDVDPLLLRDLVIANRILSDRGVLDAYGHISVRHPKKPDQFLVALSGTAPGMVTGADIVVSDLDGKPVAPSKQTGPTERYIHCEIYRNRPEVMAIVHSHSAEVIPFSITGVPLRPISQTTAFLGVEGTPIFEIREAGGNNTDLLIKTQPLGVALAKKLGKANAILMRGHGDTVVGGSVAEAVFRAVYTAICAKLLGEALKLGNVNYLSEGEIAEQMKGGSSLVKNWALWVQQAMMQAK
jgi:HCOMODA/2-hydroxy-3-carboxy-muconic semialdehyde decarboxylase